MSRTTAWTLNLAALLMAVTGIILTWMVFLAPKPAENELEILELTVVTSPWQPWLTTVHVVVAPLLIFFVGLIWFTHVYGRVKIGYEDRRAGGLVLTWVFLLVVLAGYLLQVAEAETARLVLGWTHASAGVLFAVIYLHHVRPNRARPHPAT